MSNSKNRNAEHNLIFAGLGLQLGIIAKDKVIRAFTEWLFDKARPLGEILVHQKAITPEQRKTLESAVEAHIQQEGGEQKALASLNHIKDLESDLDHLADNDLNQSLDGAVTQRKLLGLDVLFSQSNDLESSTTNKKSSFIGPEGKQAYRFEREDLYDVEIVPDPEGKQSDRFDRQHFLDSGNLGEVFFAKDTELNRTVVTKYIRPEMSGDNLKQALFHLEGEVTGSLEHPSVVPVYGLGKDIKGRLYYAMRYIRGKKLSRVIAEYHRKEAGLKQEALTGLLQNFQAVCLAIEYAHSKGVLHCDIKPDNIMIGDYGEVFVVDWGLVVVCGDVKGSSDMHEMETLDPGVIPPYRPSELASSGLHEQQGGSRRGVGGTPAYMAPEQFTATMSEDISLVTPKADIYALGSTLYHILTGKAPHLPKEGVKESPDAFYFRITTGMIPTPREKDASIPKLLEQIVLKAMQVEPEDRYTSARELAEDIKRYVSDEPVHAYQESGLEKARRWVRKNRSLVGAAMVTLLLLLATMGALGLWFIEAGQNQKLVASNKEIEAERDRANQQTMIAENEKKKAEAERDRANQQTMIAENEKKKAEAEKDRANQQTMIAEVARQKAEEEKDRADLQAKIAIREQVRAKTMEVLADNEKKRANDMQKIIDTNKGGALPRGGVLASPRIEPIENKLNNIKIINKLEMILIPNGTFKMGSPESEKGRNDDEVQHEVTITNPFYMGKYEVTQEQWEAVMGKNPSDTKGTKLPVTDVSWEDCQEFITKLNAKTDGGYRLPTEAEWEYACRARTTTAYNFGDKIIPKDANYGDTKTGKPAAVGSYKPNAFGLYDMHGNVWEWCEDWKADYPTGPVTDPKGPTTGKRRVLRGGSFNGDDSSARSSLRNYISPSDRNVNDGLRLARTSKVKPTTKTILIAPFSEAKAKEAQKETAKNLQKEVAGIEIFGKGIKLEMLIIPAGTFMRGSPSSEKGRYDNEIQHEVTITKPFYMGKYEVTQDQWEAVMGDNPSRKTKGSKLPVTDVSWEDCQDFIKKLNAKTSGGYRLPTEAEWEYACRAGTTTAYSFGNSLTKIDANYGDGTAGNTKTVGSYKPNAFGLYDMHGNVWEWCADWKAEYPSGWVTDPMGISLGIYRVLRGGSFDVNGLSARSSYRFNSSRPHNRDDDLGFRLAKTP